MEKARFKGWAGGAGFASVFFFVLPWWAYRAAFFLTDRYFRFHGIAYPSEPFAALAGWAGSCGMLGVAFFVYGFIFQKGGNSR